MTIRSRYHHPYFWIKFLAVETIGKEEILRYVYGFLVYEDLTMEPRKTKKYWDGSIQVTADTFQVFWKQLHWMYTDKERN